MDPAQRPVAARLPTWDAWFARPHAPWPVVEHLPSRPGVARLFGTFAQGAGSGGRRLLEFARPASDLRATLRRFVAEVQEHGAALGGLARACGGLVPDTAWTAAAFRHLRALASFDWEVGSLLAAEAVAVSVYEATASAPGYEAAGPVVSRLRAEACAHIAFESHLVRDRLGEGAVASLVGVAAWVAGLDQRRGLRDLGTEPRAIHDHAVALVLDEVRGARSCLPGCPGTHPA
jgi:hypothetical protein